MCLERNIHTERELVEQYTSGKNFMTNARTIAVAGKGGVGKTTVAALIIKLLREQAQGPILAIDADPDANLGTVLGIPAEKTIGELREEMLKEIKNLPPGMDKATYIETALHEIVSEGHGVDMIAMGRSEGPGCYCYVNHLLRKFTEDLSASYKWIVIDCEAGLEHLSRQNTTGAESLITVVNDSPLSVDAAIRIMKLAAEMESTVKNYFVALNAVDPAYAEDMKKRIEELPMRRIGDIPEDKAVREAILRGGVLDHLAEDAISIKAMQALVAQVQESKDVR